VKLVFVFISSHKRLVGLVPTFFMDSATSFYALPRATMISSCPFSRPKAWYLSLNHNNFTQILTPGDSQGFGSTLLRFI